MSTVLVSGCSGFIGQNLLNKLNGKYRIIGIDNFFSSSKNILDKFEKFENFRFIEDDISELSSLNEKIDIIINLACPASPPKYMSDPIFTMNTNFKGTQNLLNIAKDNHSIFIQASTSEIYGDPLVHPQIETYRGNVNTIGERSCYDEGKRIAETLCYEFRKRYKIQTRILRIFNTYGPGMDKDDGRVISNFMLNTIKGKPLKIYGNGDQTRSFCYIDDLISGIIKSMSIDFEHPINLGNNNEISLNDLADLFINNFGSISKEYIEALPDDPKVRKPEIIRASQLLDWQPLTKLEDGLNSTYKYFKSIIK
ncbi:MAG: NAD-dependent epimerase/dehydratase family protein [Bacteroidota bacterium]|nr:NAD-dependent epimerase/dehydratase family protein [Bacteroidota bacterium]|tara:strand:+ start:2236 stop:3165 length:930 start_codon:yes stop_codon:yes gene_type:complete